MSTRDRCVSTVIEETGVQAAPKDVVEYLIAKGVLREEDLCAHVQGVLFLRSWDAAQGQLPVMKVCRDIGDDLGVDTNTVHRNGTKALEMRRKKSQGV